MKKIQKLRVVSNVPLAGGTYVHMRLESTDGKPLEKAQPGQFVQIAVPDSPTTYLRRPISINDISADGKIMSLLIRVAGDGTRALSVLPEGHLLDIVYPLGHGFNMENVTGKRILLIGGGVGVAPLLHYGRCLKEAGATPVFLLGARSEKDLLLLDSFRCIGTVYTTTEDGSCGATGFVTDSVAIDMDFDSWACCGPAPMMKAVARKARNKGTECHVSLENMMACGIGACLCCVEKTVKGNKCVCTHGPVFNINELTWQ